ncbi:hypothetical protein ELQ87_22145 [Streptomyces griseoviridis]|uniref:Sigma-like protein n=1 Tax=Streptomyces griseoviridis TaxID=45398 RepID=A0A3Q9KV50_STRGD|nr:hypothetical protein [Streptomyces griseoviridis]AZS86654.1 hypothetical protein ELQ87_22145 [Streptomyces griseoviridis]QCN86483.1 hypothetical protein DDJ31_17120 [Streptomyces griseoviridis]
MSETIEPQDLHATDKSADAAAAKAAVESKDLHATSEPAALGLHAVPKPDAEEQVETEDLHATSEPFKPTR